MKLFVTVLLCACVFSTNGKNIPSELSESEKTAFIEAVKSGNVNRFQELLKDRDINKSYEKGRTALHYVAEHGNESLVEFLLQKGASIDIVDDEGLSAVHFAALNGNESVIDMLIRKGGDINKESQNKITPVHFASLNKNEKVMEILLNNGAVAGLDNIKYTALHLAAINPNGKVTDLLIKKDVNVTVANDANLTALHLAVINANPQVVDLLLKAGSDPNAVTKDGYSPAIYAVLPIFAGSTRYEDVLKNEKLHLYISKKAVETMFNNWSHPVQENTREKILELLINSGADINQKSTVHKTTILDIAVFLGDEKLQKFLTAHGAKSSQISNEAD